MKPQSTKTHYRVKDPNKFVRLTASMVLLQSWRVNMTAKYFSSQ